MIVHTCNPRKLRQEDRLEFKASLNRIVRLAQKKKKKKSIRDSLEKTGEGHLDSAGTQEVVRRVTAGPVGSLAVL